MRAFPNDFAELLSSSGQRVLAGRVASSTGLFTASGRVFARIGNVVDPNICRECVALLERRLYPALRPLRTPIPRESIWDIEELASEVLEKTVRVKNGNLESRNSKFQRLAERVGLVAMMRSRNLHSFAEVITGLQLYDKWSTQVLCYEHGDYVGPHTDFHPHNATHFVDLQLTLTNSAVAQQWFVHEERRYLTEVVDLTKPGTISLLKLPFWHYTTPLQAKRGREHEARRWVLIASFEIV